MTIVKDNLTVYEQTALRIVGGEHIEGLVGGAWLWQAVEVLRGAGLVEGTVHVKLTDAGREYLEKMNSDAPQHEHLKEQNDSPNT